MSGKSSFLKALGLLIYFAHVGFPIPARGMTTRTFNGLITSLNLSDNINCGGSPPTATRKFATLITDLLLALA